MTDDQLEEQLAARKDQLDQLGAEANRRLTDVARRRDNASARAALIISSSAIASGVQLSKTFNEWTIAAVLASLIAAGLAVPLLVFGSKPEVNVRKLTLELGAWSPRRLELEILNVKHNLIDQQEAALRWRNRLLLASLIFFGVAIACTALELIR